MTLSLEAIRTNYNLGFFFPKERYKKKRDLVLHYLILWEKTDAAVQWIFKNPEFVAVAETKSLLTPLHLCSITGNKLIVQLLLKYPSVSLAVQDCQEWTPLHHAALREKTVMLDILLFEDSSKQHGASGLKNKNNGTYQDLRRLAYPDTSLLEQAIVFNYLNQSNSIVGGTKDDFLRITGAKFVNQIHASRVFFMEEWGHPTKIKKLYENFSKLLKHEYESYQQKKPSLYIATEDAGCGVFANENIGENSILVDYLGEAIHGERPSTYAVELCDGTRLRNLGPLVNDGFPNCADFPIVNVNGFPIVTLLRSVRAIKKGEQLLWHYGSKHPVKSGRYIDLAGTIAENYFKSCTVLQSSFAIGFHKDILSIRGAITPVHYLLGTQSFQILSLLKQVVDIDEFYTVSTDSYFSRNAFLFDIKKTEKSLEIVSHIFKLCNQEPNPQQAKKDISILVEQLFFKFNVSTIVRLLEALTVDNPEVVEHFKEIIKTDGEQRKNLFVLAKQFEDIENLYENFLQKDAPPVVGQQLARSLMELKGPLAIHLMVPNFIWPLKEMGEPEKYKSFLDTEGFRPFLKKLDIFY